MMRAKRIFLAFATAVSLFSMACSQRWIDADAGVSADQIVDRVREVQSPNGATALNQDASEKSLFDEILETEGAYIYYTDGGGNSVMGPALAAAGLLEFGFMGESASSVIAEDLTEAVVVYVEDVDRAALMIQIHTGTESQPITRYYSSTSPPEYNGDEYTVLLGQGGGPILRLTTFNTTENDLQGIVRFQVYDFTSDGIEQWLGQFGAMVGYF